MTIITKQQKIFSSLCGNYKVGMTREQALKDGLDLSIFNEIDSLGEKQNGILEEDEICKYRDIECSKKKKKSIGLAVGALISSVAGAALAFSGIAPAIGMGCLVLSLSMGGVGVVNLQDSKNQTKITEQHRTKSHSKD